MPPGISMVKSIWAAVLSSMPAAAMIFLLVWSKTSEKVFTGLIIVRIKRTFKNIPIIKRKNKSKKDSELYNTMKTLLLLVALIVLVVVTTPWADDFIYDRPYGGKKIGRIDENGFVYDKAYGGKKIGRVKDGEVYDKAYGGKAIGRIDDDGKLYNEPYEGKSVGRYKNGKVYDSPYGGSVIGGSDSKEGVGYWLLEEEGEE